MGGSPGGGLARARRWTYGLAMHVTGISRRVLVALIVAGAAVLVFGTTVAAGMLTRHTITHTQVLAAAPTIMVDAGIGDVDVVATDRTDVRLTTRERRSVWGGGHVKVRGDSARLDLHDGCDGLPTSVPLVYERCVVRYRLEVPRGSDVRVSTATGDIRAKNLQGSADLGSSTGDVRVNGASGPLRLHTAAGDVRVHAPAPDMVAQTLAGDIELVASHPRALRAESAAGDVTLVVPKQQTYAVDAQGEGGNQQILVPLDDASPRRLLAHSEGGHVTVVPG
jgi:Toastrack DUF4097